MTTLHSKHGFPIVKELDFTAAKQSLSDRGTGVTQEMNKPRKKNKNKSLFAMQFEDKKLDFFGIDVDSLTDEVPECKSQRDHLEPVLLGTEINLSHGMEYNQTSESDGGVESLGVVESLGGAIAKDEVSESIPAVLCDWYVSVCYVHACLCNDALINTKKYILN